MPNNPDGGPAFPSPSLACMEYRPMPGDEGMTLRAVAEETFERALMGYWESTKNARFRE